MDRRASTLDSRTALHEPKITLCQPTSINANLITSLKWFNHSQIKPSRVALSVAQKFESYIAMSAWFSKVLVSTKLTPRKRRKPKPNLKQKVRRKLRLKLRKRARRQNQVINDGAAYRLWFPHPAWYLALTQSHLR